MKQVLVNVKGKNGYEIYVDDVLFINTDNALRSYHEIIDELFTTKNDYWVTVTNDFTTINQNINDANESFKQNINADDARSKIDSGFNPFEFKGGKYKETFTNTESDDQNFEADEETNPIAPGSVIYVDSVMGTLVRATGGLAVVLGSYESESGDVMIEVETLPNIYYSWNELESAQDALKEKYGNRPAMRII